MDITQHDSYTSSPIDSGFDSEDQQKLYWHTDSKPGTIV